MTNPIDGNHIPVIHNVQNDQKEGLDYVINRLNQQEVKIEELRIRSEQKDREIVNLKEEMKTIVERVTELEQQRQTRVTGGVILGGGAGALVSIVLSLSPWGYIRNIPLGGMVGGFLGEKYHQFKSGDKLLKLFGN